MTEQTEARRVVPPGDITWDGRTLSAGGVELTPGEYEIGRAVLTVYPDVDPDPPLADADLFDAWDDDR